MKRIISIYFLVLFAISSLKAQVNANLQKISSNDLNFIVASDMGRRGVSEQKNVAGVMGLLAELNKIGFIAVAGDPIHDNGVTSIDDPEWKLKFENIYTASSLQNIPWYVVSGNHEYHGSVQAIMDYSKQSQRWKAPARYYALEKKIGNGKDRCLFVFIDTTPLIDKYRKSGDYSDADQQDIEKELKWIDSTLTVSTSRWKIVIGHHPVYADTDKADAERLDMQERLGTILEKRKADLYISGHIHNFQHIRPAGKILNYIVNSSAAEARSVKPIEGTLYCSSNPGITLCSLSENSFTFFFINNKGETLYKYTISKPAKAAMIPKNTNSIFRNKSKTKKSPADPKKLLADLALIEF